MRRRPARSGLLAAGPALLVLAAAAPLVGRGPLELAADGATRLIPLPLFELLLGLLGSLAKGLLLLVLAAGALALGAVGGSLAARAGLPGRFGRARSAVAIALAAACAGFVVTVPSGEPLVGLLPLALAAAGYGTALVLLLADAGAPAAAPGGGEGSPGLDPGALDPGRRSFLRGSAGVAAAALVAGGSGLVLRVLGAARLPDLGATAAAAPLVDAWGVSPAITPVPDFYVVAASVAPPAVDRASWRLEVAGLVAQPRSWSLDELATLPEVAGERTLQCISNEVTTYGPYIGNQRWRGVRARDVIDAAGPTAEARWVIWRSADGYHESLPLEVARDERTWLVREMGGAPLTVEHGAPMRVLIAGRYGMKQPKFLSRIELAAEDEPGWWEERGWDRDAIVRTYSRIDAPIEGERVAAAAPLMVYGVASAGDRGISRVEVSADDGATWADAELDPRPGAEDLAWVRWRVRLPAPGTPGDRFLRARATDGTGALQEETETTPLPAGATGLHRVRVRAG